MHIANTKTVGDLRKEFNEAFPYLKIEFYSMPYKAKELLPKDKIIRHGAPLAQCRKSDNEGTIELKPELTVAALEQALWENYGLSVQVFRKSGPLWIETSLTDSWTLLQQNYEGEQLSIGIDNTPQTDWYDRDQTE